MVIPNKNRKEKFVICFFGILVVVLIFSTFIVVYTLYLHDNDIDNSEIKSSNDSNFDILNFWEKEIERVNNTPLNILYGDNLTVSYQNPYTSEVYQFNAQEIYFDAPNWVNATPIIIRLHGYLLYPTIIKSSNPGCLCMHGLVGKVEEAFILAKSYIDKGFIVFCYSHPGHGKSEGAEPTPNNFLYSGNYNQSAHYYLSLCGAIQGLRVLEQYSKVNNSEIMVTGISYGGLNAMWLASICGERIAGVISYIAIGDIAKNLDYPSKLIFWILGKSPNEIPDSYLQDQNLRFDPIYYLCSPKLPPILWQIGTNDDFFHYSAIKGTFDAVTHDDKYLQIFPNEHHGFPGFEDTTQFFIDYIINKTASPPTVNIIIQNVTAELIGDTLHFQIDINSSMEIDSVQICFNYIDIPGYCWSKLTMTEIGNNSWQIHLNPAILTSKLDFYFIINIKTDNQIWFSSNIISKGIIVSNFSIPFIIIIIVFITVPLGIIIWRRYHKIQSRLDKNLKLTAKKYFFIELSSISIIEFLFYSSLFLPWFAYEGGNVTFSHFYIFNNLFTWKLFLGELSYSLTILFFVGWIIYSIVSLIKPVISGVLKLIYPIFILFYFIILIISSGVLDPNSLISNFGLIYPGLGLFIMLLASLGMILLGYWRKKYELKIGLRKPKTKLLDRIKKFITYFRKKLHQIKSKRF